MAKVESFDGLISSIQDAFLSVNKMAEQQHLESIKEFFDDEGKRNDNNGFEVCAAPEKKKKKMGFIPEYRKKSDDGYANITLKFNAEDPPEGIMRIRDEMIKILP